MAGRPQAPAPWREPPVKQGRLHGRWSAARLSGRSGAYRVGLSRPIHWGKAAGVENHHLRRPQHAEIEFGDRIRAVGRGIASRMKDERHFGSASSIGP